MTCIAGSANAGSDHFTAAFTEGRNHHWQHMFNADVISMPDKWEYPWFAAWDLAFHVIALTLVDEDFAKGQIEMILRSEYLHPNGQVPAYEWNFGDVNPPVHAWATIFTYRLEQAARGEGDLEWLERVFHKLLLNFTWWVNRKDQSGNNLFEGGFLGLDNIGVFDRSAPLPTGGYLEQADGTAWMALFCQNMLEIAAELAMHRPAYKPLAEKFVEHFLLISTSMMHGGGDAGMWDEEDGFFYDVLRPPDGASERLKVRSMVGLLPLCAVTSFDGELLRRYPDLVERIRRLLLVTAGAARLHPRPMLAGEGGRRLASILDETKLRRVLSIMLDESEFLSAHGIRSLSRYHLDHPYVFRVGDDAYRVDLPAGRVRQRDVRRQLELARSGLDAGQRPDHPGPAPVLRVLRRRLHIECPTGSGTADDALRGRPRDRTSPCLDLPARCRGHRPVYGGMSRFQDDPAWRDNILFHEYFHGDDGAGLGASHQTGWTGVIARAMHLFATTSPEQVVEAPRDPYACGGGEMGTPRYPSLYEINTRVWLTDHTRSLGRPATLDDVTDAELDDVAAMGFDWVWLLSVWHTGGASRAVSRTDPGLRQEFEATLPGPAGVGHRGLGLRDHRLHRGSRIWAATSRSPGCATA